MGVLRAHTSKFLNYDVSVPKDCFYLGNQCRPWGNVVHIIGHFPLDFSLSAKEDI